MTAGPPDTTSDSDVDLLRRHVEGDPDAFAEIFLRHRDHLWAIALRTMSSGTLSGRTTDAEEAADALQEALISAMRHAESFRGDAKVSTWLHRIVVNACLDRLRRRVGRATQPLPDDDHAPAVQRDPFDDSDVAADVESALATLPFEQRAAIVLIDIEGYSVEEAAAMLDAPTGTIKSRCARGRAKLVPLLAHLRGGNPDVIDTVERPTAQQPATQPPARRPIPERSTEQPREELR